MKCSIRHLRTKFQQRTRVLMEELIQQTINSATRYLLCDVMLYYYSFMKEVTPSAEAGMNGEPLSCTLFVLHS